VKVPDRLLRLSEAAEQLNVTYDRAAELARQGLLPVVRLGRQIRVSPERLADFVANGGKALPGGWRKEAR
jgi:excisionase family DNA binding protein